MAFWDHGCLEMRVCLFLSCNTKASEKFHNETWPTRESFVRENPRWWRGHHYRPAETLLDMYCGIECAGPLSGVQEKSSVLNKSDAISFSTSALLSTCR